MNNELTANNVPIKKSSNFSAYFKRSWQLYLMLLLPVLYFLIFKYLPIVNARIAFVDYNMFLPISESPWNNFAHFKELFGQPLFWRALRNTIVLNMLDLIIGFPIPIIIALILNELIGDKIKKFTQTIIYIPHFLSWVIVAGIVMQVFSSTGIVNTMLFNVFGMEPVSFLTDPFKWVCVYIGTGVWKGAGYSTIIYLAALSAVDPSLYEAAYVDGAGRMKRILNITLPCIKGTIIMMLILQAGNLLSISFDRPFMMSNPLVLNVSDVISTYVYRVGLQGSRFDYATAVGLFQSVVAFVILMGVNYSVKKMGEEGIV